MRCIVCDSNDWKNADIYRIKNQDMHICNSCGFVSYPLKYKTEEEIKAYYKTDYRKAPNASNIFTGERKLAYHHHFLTPLFSEWKKAGLDAPVIGEIGSAIGMFLKWVQGQFPNADLYGTELTQTYKNVAKHYHGIELHDDFDYSKKYDLIVSYHVLEHQLDADLMLKKYAECLKDTGLFYLSCPIWFRDANNSAKTGFDIEDYWHPDHINSWSEEHLEYIIAKAGLEIVFKDTIVYGNTYILRKTDKAPVRPDFNVKEYEDKCANLLQAFKLLEENKTLEAMKVWPNCVVTWIKHYELNRVTFDKNPDSLESFIRDITTTCPNGADAYMFAADIYGRYDRFSDAQNMFLKALDAKPNNPTLLLGLAQTFRQKALRTKNISKEEKQKLLSESANICKYVNDISHEVTAQAITWMFHDMALLD